MDAGRNPTTAEVVAASASTGLAGAATYLHSGGLIGPALGSAIFMALGFAGLGFARSLGPHDPRARIRLVMAFLSFALSAVLFLFYPAFA